MFYKSAPTILPFTTAVPHLLYIHTVVNPRGYRGGNGEAEGQEREVA